MTFADVDLSEVKGYWDDRPCNIRHSTQPIGTWEYSKEVRERKYRVEPHIPTFAQFSKWSGKRVLEIGCGIGTDTLSFAEAGANVTAVDISEHSLDIARARAQSHGMQYNISFYQGNAEELIGIIPPRRYDLIYSFGVLHHTPHPNRAFEQLSCFADSDTEIKLMLYNRHSAKVLGLTKGRIWDDKAIALQSEAQTGCPVTYTYTRNEITKLLSCWFDVKSVHADHIFPYKLEDYLQYKYTKHWWAEMPGFHKVEQLLGWHLLIEARGRS